MSHAEKTSQSGSAQHFFLYLISFLSLSFLVFGFGGIIFQFINKFFPDPLIAAFEGVYDQDAVKFGIASILVAGPIFFLVKRNIIGKLRRGEIGEDSKVRRWLTYIVLFFAAATAIGDLIAILFSFLGGEITARFLLKAATILTLALSVLSYYFWDMRKRGMERKTYPLDAIAAWASAFALVVVFASSFFLIDSPSVAREKRMDEQAVSDLQNADNSLRGYFDQAGTLPASLEELDKTNFAVAFSKDSALEYFKISDNTFALCAQFKRSDAEGSPQAGRLSKGFPENTWQHEAGRVCFERVAVRSESVPALPK